MAAIPLQGFAAGTMLFCKGMGAATVQAVSHEHAIAQDAMHSQAAHDHAKHDHAAPGHGGDAKLAKAGDAAKSMADSTQDGSNHTCGVCASCCHVVAISQFSPPLQFTPLPPAQSAEPFVQIHARATPVPDKPPRA